MDNRTDTQKRLDGMFGMPLYYCAECKCAVDVKMVKGEVVIKRPCTDCSAQIIAPRKAIAIGKGGASISTKSKILFSRLMALMTQRSGV